MMKGPALNELSQSFIVGSADATVIQHKVA